MFFFPPQPHSLLRLLDPVPLKRFLFLAGIVFPRAKNGHVVFEKEGGESSFLSPKSRSPAEGVPAFFPQKDRHFLEQVKKEADNLFWGDFRFSGGGERTFFKPQEGLFLV